MSTAPECADQKFLLSLLPDIQQMNPIQKRQFKRKVLDVIGCILEDQGQGRHLRYAGYTFAYLKFETVMFGPQGTCTWPARPHRKKKIIFIYIKI